MTRVESSAARLRLARAACCAALLLMFVPARAMAQALYVAYRQAAAWAMANASDAAKMIAEATRLNARALEEALKSGRLGLNVQPAVNGKDTVLAALQLAMHAKQVEKVPAAESFFYTGLK